MSEKKEKRIFAADGNWYAHRAFHTVDPNIEGATRRFNYTFTSMICKDALAKRCRHIIVAFDGPQVFRYKLYRKYKVGRNEKISQKSEVSKVRRTNDAPKDDLAPLMPQLLEHLTALTIPWVRPKNYEGDDVLAAIAHHYHRRNEKSKRKDRRSIHGTKAPTLKSTTRVILGIEDKDLYQVVSETTEMYISTNPQRTIRAEQVVEKYGVPPELMIDYQTMMGDSIDGVPSIGFPPRQVKAKLLEFGGLDNWRANATEDERIMFIKNAEQIELNRRLVTMGHDCYVPHLSDLVVQKIETQGLDVPASFIAYQDYLWPRSKGLF